MGELIKAEPLQLRMENCDANGAHIDDQVLTTLGTKLHGVPRLTTDRSIYRVPILLRSVNPKAYTPQLVSIGPLHHGVSNLQPMEIHKLRYLQDFLDRDPQKTMDFYFEKLKGYEERARQHYDEQFKLATNIFVEMMLIDGCFVIEFMLRYISREPRNNNDFLLTAPSMSPCIKVDMQLLENQLPFFVIEYLFDLLNNNPHGQILPFSFRHLAFRFFSLNCNLRLSPGSSINNRINHFVDFIRQRCVPSSESKEPEKFELIPSATELDQAGVKFLFFSHNCNLRLCLGNSINNHIQHFVDFICVHSSKSKEPENFELIPSATELYQAGVKFEKSTDNAECFLDISFRYKKNGVLTICIPAIRVEDGTEILFRNLIALDFLHNYEGNYVTSYISLMDQLINTPQDVALLRRKGIINNWLGNDDEVSHFVNKLSTWTSTGDQFYYAQLRKNVNAYYKRRRPKWWAILMREYFKTPWSTASLVAAIILLVCTIVSTVCSLISVIKT